MSGGSTNYADPEGISREDEAPSRPPVRYLAETEPIRYIPWYRKPLVRQIGEDVSKYDKRPTAPSYLVLDLTISRCLATLGSTFEGHLNQTSGTQSGATGLFVFLTLFFPIFWQWLNMHHFTNRYDAEDMVFLLHFIVNMVLMCYAGVTITTCATTFNNPSQVEKCPGLSGTLAGMRFYHVLMTIYVWYHNTRYTKYFTRTVIKDILVTILWTIGIFMEDYAVAVVYWIAIAIDLVAFVGPHFLPSDTRRKQGAEAPYMHPNLLAARHNRFNIISLSWIVSNSFAALKPDHTLDSHEAIAIVFAALFAVGLKMQYFDLFDVSSPADSDVFGAKHPVVRTEHHQRYRVSWEFTHFFLNMSTVLVGSATRYYVGEDRLQRPWLCVPLAAAGALTVSQQLLSSGGRNFADDKLKKRLVRKTQRIGFRIFSIAVLVALPFIFTDKIMPSNDLFVGIVAIWFSLSVVGDVAMRMPSKQLERRIKSHEANYLTSDMDQPSIQLDDMDKVASS